MYFEFGPGKETSWSFIYFLQSYYHLRVHNYSLQWLKLNTNHYQLKISFIHSFISIQPYRPGWQEPEHSHVTGMALAHCIMGKFLGVVCHRFPPPLDVPTFAARCLYVRNDARDPSSKRWNCEREICPVILPKFRLPLKFRDLLHAANLRHGVGGFTFIMRWKIVIKVVIMNLRLHKQKK